MLLNSWQLLGIFIVMAVSSYLITPVFRNLANAKGVLDHPGGRKTQRKPVPYLGGLAIALPITLASLGLAFSSIDSAIKSAINWSPKKGLDEIIIELATYMKK